MAKTQGGVRWVPRDQWEKEANLEAKIRDLEAKIEMFQPLIDESLADKKITFKLCGYRVTISK